MEVLINDRDDSQNTKYKKFQDTYKQCAFFLALSFIYPTRNRKVMYKKLMTFAIVMLFNLPALFWFTTYLIQCMMRMDIFNLSRQLTIGVIIFLFFFKIFFVTRKNEAFCQLLEIINADLLKGNYLEKEYQDIYDEGIRSGKQAEKVWIFIPVILSSIFPVYAAGAMIYNIFTFSEKPQTRVMVHDMELMFIKDKQYQSPIFEIYFVYTMTQCFLLSPNFTGFDGSFCICTTHLCMKLKLFARKLTNAFSNTASDYELEEMVKEAIRDHQDILNFYKLVQDSYDIWLFVCFFVTFICVSLNLYQLSLSGGVDAKYLVFTLCCVAHMFAPCYFAANLTKLGGDICDEIYAVSWECRGNVRATKMLLFIIARAQKPFRMTGKGIATFNMQLFVSIMQTCYSFYTLIK